MLTKALIIFDYTLLKDTVDKYNDLMLELLQLNDSAMYESAEWLQNDPISNILQYTVDMIFVHEVPLEEIIQDFLLKASSAIDRLVMDAYTSDDLASLAGIPDKSNYSSLSITTSVNSTSGFAEAKEFLNENKSVYDLIGDIYEKISWIPRKTILDLFKKKGTDNPEIYTTNVKLTGDSLFIYFYQPPQPYE